MLTFRQCIWKINVRLLPLSHQIIPTTMCKSPTYIINPSYNRLNHHGYTELYAYGELVAQGINHGNHKPYWILRVYREDFQGKTQKQLDEDFQLFNPTTKKYTSLIMAAPCRKCDECLRNRFTELLCRSKFEYASDPLQELAFFTLTYAPQYLPQGQNVSREDINDFRRRFSIYFNRLCNKTGEYETPRMVICSEYGPAVDKLGRIGKRRPHYHGFMFLGNYRPSSDLSPVEYYRKLNEMFTKLRSAVFRAWHRCYSPAFDMQLAKHPLKTLNYCTKYVLKQQYKNAVPAGRVDNFCSMPRGSRGGLSAPFLHSETVTLPSAHKPVYSVSIDFRYWDESTNSLSVQSELVSYPRYLTEKIFPTFSRINSSIIHQKVQQYEYKLRNFRSLIDLNAQCNREGFVNRFRSDLRKYEEALPHFVQSLLPSYSKKLDLRDGQLRGHYCLQFRPTYSTPRAEYESSARAANSVFFPQGLSWSDPLGNGAECNGSTSVIYEFAPQRTLSEQFDYETTLTSLRSDLESLFSSLTRALSSHTISQGLAAQRDHDLYKEPLRLRQRVGRDNVVNQTKLDSFFRNVDNLTDFSYEHDNANDAISARYKQYTDTIAVLNSFTNILS